LEIRTDFSDSQAGSGQPRDILRRGRCLREPVPDLTPYGGVELTAVGESDQGPAGGVEVGVGALRAGSVGVDGRALEGLDNVHVAPGVVLELLVSQASWTITGYFRKDLTTAKEAQVGPQVLDVAVMQELCTQVLCGVAVEEPVVQVVPVVPAPWAALYDEISYVMEAFVRPDRLREKSMEESTVSRRNAPIK
jgi:hypothetical protein